MKMIKKQEAKLQYYAEHEFVFEGNPNDDYDDGEAPDIAEIESPESPDT